jgi:hypothetical protein
MVKLSRDMYPGDDVEFWWWVCTFGEPWRGYFERMEELTDDQAIQLGYAVLAQRPLTEDNKTFLVSLFYAIYESRNPA